MQIFIDGPDNTGKSSQVHAIINEFNDRIFLQFHLGAVHQPPENSIPFSSSVYRHSIETMLYQESLGFSSICDRSHISEFVYAQKYRNYDGSYVFDIEKEYDLSKFVLIILVDEPQSIIDRDDGLSLSIDIEDKKYEIQKYTEGAELSSMCSIVINVQEGLQSTSDKIIKFLKDVYGN